MGSETILPLQVLEEILMKLLTHLGKNCIYWILLVRQLANTYLHLFLLQPLISKE